MDLRQLRYFVAVAERGGFGGCGQRAQHRAVGAQPARQGARAELGGALLVAARAAYPSPSPARCCSAAAAGCSAAIDDIKAEVRTENREPSGTVRLGAPSSLADIFYAPLAHLFVKRFPRVRFELSEGLTEGMCDRLLRGELDLALVTRRSPMTISTTKRWWSSRCS